MASKIIEKVDMPTLKKKEPRAKFQLGKNF